MRYKFFSVSHSKTIMHELNFAKVNIKIEKEKKKK